MLDTPELFWKVRTEKDGRSSIEYLTAQQISIRGLVRAILDGGLSKENAYVRIGNANFQSFKAWTKSQSTRRGKK